MKRQGFHRWEKKKWGSHAFILQWNTVNDVVRQGMLEIKSYEPSHHLFPLCVHGCVCACIKDILLWSSTDPLVSRHESSQKSLL